MLCPLPKLPPLQCRALRFSAFHVERTIGLILSETWGKVNEQKRALRAQTLKGSYTKHKRAFLLISVFRRQKKTHFLKCSLEIFCFEVVKEFSMWDKGETLAWSEDNSLFLRGLGLNCRECWHSAQAQLPWPQHLLKKVELETCALHSLLIIAVPASTIVHVLWHSQSLHLGFAQDSVDKPDDECGKLLPERVWLGLRLKFLAKDYPVVFCSSMPNIGSVPFCRRLHDAKRRCSTCRWLIIRLTVLIAGLCQLLFWHDTTQDLFHVQFPLSLLTCCCSFFQQQRLACRRLKLNIIWARNSVQITHKVLPSQLAGIADRYEMFHLSNPQHTCSHNRWVSGDFLVLEVSMESQISQVCESENTARPFLCADRECQDLCLPTSIYHGLVCSKMLLLFINSFICKRPGSSCCLCCHIPGSLRLIDWWSRAIGICGREGILI